MTSGSPASSWFGIQQPTHQKWAASLGALLPVVAPVALLGGALVAASKALIQPDTWVALAAGREVADHGLPSVERLTLLAQGRPWVDQQWLAQVALYGVDRIGGVGMVVSVCLAAVLTGFAFVAAAAAARGGSPGALIFWVVAGFLAGPTAALVRTQSLAIPLFAVILWLILRDPDLRDGVSLWILPLLVLWANVHGSVVLGAALVSLYGLQALVRTGNRRVPAAVFALAPLTVLASPYALRLPGYYHTMLVAPPYGRQIVEWQRTTPANAPLFFVVAGICTLVIVARWRRLRPIDAIVLALTFAGALSAVRLTLWFGIAVIAIMPPLTSSKIARTSDFIRPAAGLVAAVVLAAGVAGLAWDSHRDYNGSSKLIAVLRNEPRTARVAANYTLADWVLWEAPNLRGRVDFDARAELLTKQEWRYMNNLPPAALSDYTLLVTGPEFASRVRHADHHWRVEDTDHGVVLLQRGVDASTQSSG